MFSGKIILLVIRTLVCFLCTIGLGYSLYIAAYVLSLADLPSLTFWYKFKISFLIVYFIYCIICSLGRVHGKMLLISGVGMHILLAVSFIGSFEDNRNVFLLYIAGFFTVLWTILYLAQTFYEVRYPRKINSNENFI